MTISEKAAYIKGLADGSELDKQSKEGKILYEVIDLLGEIGAALTELNENDLNIGDELDAIYEELEELEDAIFEEDDEDDHECGCGDDCDCDDEDFMISITCPNCGEEIVIDESILDAGSLRCPNCDETLELEIIEDDEDEEEEEDD